jgi:lysozyme
LGKSRFIDLTVEDLKVDEGFRSRPYKCTKGVWTFGYGFTYITKDEAEAILRMRVEKLNHKLLNEDWYQQLDEVRRSAIVNMAFNLGFAGLRKFKKMIWALTFRFWNAAHQEALDSKWARDDVPNRARKIAGMLRNGRR